MTREIDKAMSADERLWRLVVAGDTAAFQTVVDRYQGAVSAIAFSVLGDFAASQDVAQETFWDAWTSREKLRDLSRLGGWLCGIARNLAHDWRRRNRNFATNRLGEFNDPVSPTASPVEQSISAEEESIVWNSLQELPEHYREVLALYYRQGKTAAEVALALELSDDAVKQRLSRGRDLLREQVALMVEDVLVRSRPGKNFTTKVMAGIIGAAATAHVSGATAAAATAGGIGSGAAAGAASFAAKSIAASSAVGLAGGLLGAAGGLGGAFLGTWLPAELAPTQTERELLRRFGRRQFRVAIVYTVAILAATPLLFLPRCWIAYVGVLIGGSLALAIYVAVQSLRLQRQIRELRMRVTPSADPNLSLIKQRLTAATKPGGPARWKGRTYTSATTFLSLPLVDIQVSDPFSVSGKPPRERKTARGWIAIGDRAHGILIGIGGQAYGVIAIGGVAVGVFSLGGLALGVASLGGLAAGWLGLGGLALGQTAVGGCAIGWNAAGGAAIGWYSAAGGLAIANHAAMGGLAIARDFAVGGQAIAAQANTVAAKAAVDRETLKWILDWIVANRIWFSALIVAISVAPALMLRWFYDSQGERGEAGGD